MPCFVTHLLFGREVLRSASDERIPASALLYPSAYEWGLQGPDLMFFSVLPKPGYENLARFGGILHSQKTEELFSCIFSYLSVQTDPEDRKILVSYILGFLGHYTIDKNVHPFVYYFEQQGNTDEKGRKRYSYHHQIEGELDSYFYWELCHSPVSEVKLYRETRSQKRTYQAIARMYTFIAQELYGLRISSKRVMKCFRNGVLLLNLRMERGKGKRRVAGILERLMGKRGMLTGFLIPFRADGSAANLVKKRWRNLHFPEQERNESFPELVSASVTELQQRASLFLDAVEAGEYRPLSDRGLAFDNGSFHRG